MRNIRTLIVASVIITLLLTGLSIIYIESNQRFWTNKLKTRDFAIPPPLENFPPAGKWYHSQLADFDGDNILDLLLCSWNGTIMIVNGSGNILPGWPKKLQTGQKPLPEPVSDDFLSLGTPQMVIYDANSGNHSLSLVDNHGVLLQQHSVAFPEDTNARLHYLPQRDSNLPLVVLWAQPFWTDFNLTCYKSDSSTLWIYSPTINYTYEFSIQSQNEPTSYVLPTYNTFEERWELDILTANATVFRYTLLGDLITTFSLPGFTNTPYALLFSVPNIRVGQNLIFCLNDTGEMCAWGPTGEIQSEWTIQLDDPLPGGTWIGNYPLLADITIDGTPEIILVGVRPNKIYIFDITGQIIPGWPQVFPFPESITSYTTPVIIDVTRDSSNELLFSVLMGFTFNYYDFQGNFSPVWQENPPNSYYQTTDFLIGDITGDNRCELIYSMAWGKPGIVTAVETGWVGHAPWPFQRGPTTNIFWDTDQDGLQDKEEVFFGTSVTSNDSDNDGLSDYSELNQYLTDPLSSDSDHDSLSDGREVQIGLNPRCPDSNYNGIIDGFDPLPRIRTRDLIRVFFGVGLIGCLVLYLNSKFSRQSSE
ncbi:MAG: hypothetical protein ACFE95_07120 [Candidatus Hodarchaeota archaeon]